MGNSKELTKQQKIFVEEYIKTGSGLESIKKAYPKSVKWTKNTQYVFLNKLLNNNKINLRIKEYNEKIEKNLNESITLNKRKILEEIIELQNKCKTAGNSQNTVNLQALKLLSQIAGMLQEQTTNININNTNQTLINDVSNYLNL